MLAEIRETRQVAGEGFRRWFRDQENDLIVWYTDDSCAEITGFQYCYDTERNEHALTWTKAHGYQHHKVDDGDVPFAARRSPVLVQDGHFDPDDIHDQFRAVATDLEPEVVSFVSTRIAAAPGR